MLVHPQTREMASTTHRMRQAESCPLKTHVRRYKWFTYSSPAYPPHTTLSQSLNSIHTETTPNSMTLGGDFHIQHSLQCFHLPHPLTVFTPDCYPLSLTRWQDHGPSATPRKGGFQSFPMLQGAASLFDTFLHPPPLGKPKPRPPMVMGASRENM